MFPVDTLLKSEMRGVKGELKRPFDKAAKDYESKYIKIEKEKKSQAKEVGMIRTEVNPAEIADEMEKERKMFQLQMCEVSGGERNGRHRLQSIDIEFRFFCLSVFDQVQ